MEITFTSEIKVETIQEMGGDHMVVAAAKVSTSGVEARKFAKAACPVHTVFDEAWRTCDLCKPWREQAEANRGLIRYLMKMRHGTPFEHSAVTFFVHAPIFVWREWHRHRLMSYNEESGRYKQLDPVFYIPPRDRPMMKVEGWKPGRPKFMTLDEFFEEKFKDEPEGVRAAYAKESADLTYANIYDSLRYSYDVAYRAYERNLSLSIDPGLARDCLPVGIYSSCWVTCNPRSLMHFLSLRTHEESSQFVSYPLYEIEVAARAVEQAFAQGWPMTYAAFVENGRVGP